MQQEHYQQIAIGAALLAVVAAITSGRLPRWMRTTLVVALLALAAGAGLFAYRYVTNPVTLTVAAGSLDGDVPRFMAALASRMSSSDAGVRLKVVDKGTAWEAAKAFSAGDVDLAVVRADVGDLSAAQTVVVVTRGVVLIVVPPVNRPFLCKGRVVGDSLIELGTFGHVASAAAKRDRAGDLYGRAAHDLMGYCARAFGFAGRPALGHLSQRSIRAC